MPGFQHYDTTEEEVVEFLRKTKELEPDKVSSVVLFGGEPTLNMELIRFIYKTATEHPKNSFFFNITSNGIKIKDENFAKEFFDFLKTTKEQGIGTSLDISYDYQGNNLRVYPDGRDSTPDVKLAINRANEYLNENLDAFDFRIRCTIQHLNYDKILQNSIYTFEKYKNTSRIIYTYAYNDMIEHFGDAFFDEYINEYGKKLVELGKMYDKYICFQTEICLMCKRCTIANDGIKYRYQTPGSDKETYLLEGNAKEFNLFHNLVKPIEKDGDVKIEDLKEGMDVIKGIINE